LYKFSPSEETSSHVQNYALLKLSKILFKGEVNKKSEKSYLMKIAVFCDVKPEDGGKKFIRNFVSSLFETLLCDVKPEDGGKKFIRNFVSSLFEEVNKFWH